MTLVFAGGGTGGHLYPALAIHSSSRRSDGERPGEGSAIFLCSDRPLDAAILTREDVDFIPIKARPIAASPKALIRLAWRWGGAVRAARDVLRDLEDPVVVAMGGYVAAPVVQAARAERIPILLVNLDAVPGKANRWIARHATRVVTASPVAQDWERIPPIVRDTAIGGDPRHCRGQLGLDPDRPTLLVSGGSQGARSINHFMAAFAGAHADALRPWQVIHQCGAGEEDDLRFAYEASNIPALVMPFIDPMGPAWGAAELAVSRAGAGSVAEAWANRVPTLFMPYPFHKDQHQRRNAEVLHDACVIARDRITPHDNLREAGQTLLTLLTTPTERQRLRTALSRLGPTNGVERVSEVLDEMRSSTAPLRPEGART